MCGSTAWRRKSSADLGEIVQMIWLTPAMDRLFIESAGGRRRFLDRLVLGFDAGHARAATRYETAMRERARLLKYGPRDPAWLDGLENEMAEAGVAIAAARAATVERLNRALAERGEAAPFPPPPWRSTGEDLRRARTTLRDALGALAASATPKRAHHCRAASRPIWPCATPQKRADARDCSTGEQKALLISIMLADARELARARDGMAPLLLLDEIAAHLDVVRRAALFEEIADLGAQAWMTGTDLSLFERLRARRFSKCGTAFSARRAHDSAAQFSALLPALCGRHRGAGTRRHRHRRPRPGHRASAPRFPPAWASRSAI